MYDEAGTVSKFVNPFSQDVRRMSERFDNATINHNFNELEHKYTKVYDIISKKDIPEYGDGLALYVSEELYEVVILLLKILREAIISLSLCVNIAEIPKREARISLFYQ